MAVPHSLRALLCPLGLLTLLLFSGGTATAWSQESSPEGGSDFPEEMLDAEPIDVPPDFGAALSGLGDDISALTGLELLRSGKLIRARELAEEILREQPDAFAGHGLLGMVLHRGEGNLPRALYHLKRGRALFEARHGLTPDDTSPWLWHALIISELAFVTGEMGRDEEKLSYLATRDRLYDPDWPADRGWPLMRLKRYDEAREAVRAGLLLEDDDQTAAALTALCAIEAELHDRKAAYRACNDAADQAREVHSGPTPFTNAAEATLGMLELDEAERLILEGTDRFLVGTVSNPWMDLMLLYLGEGRIAEALDALRHMADWRDRQPAYIDEQNRAETDAAAALFLLISGHAEEASRITARSLEQPDRTGFTSSESEQLEAATALLDSLIHRTLAAYKAEEASWSGLRDGLAARLASLQHRWRAWTSARRAASLLGERRRLVATLRPYLAGSVEIPEWVEPELTAILGPGVVAAALAEARQSETLAGASGYFDAFAAEIALLQGREGEASIHVTAALDGLPGSELLLRARVAGIGAQAALARGDRGRAMELLDLALQLDPGVIRRLGLALPTVFEAAPGPVATGAVHHLLRSPRFTSARSGFRVRVEGTENAGRASLIGLDGSVLVTAEALPRAGERAEDTARRLAQELHQQAFAPRLDLTQNDLRSLDGSPTAGGGRSARRLRGVLKALEGKGDESLQEGR